MRFFMRFRLILDFLLFCSYIMYSTDNFAYIIMQYLSFSYLGLVLVSTGILKMEKLSAG